MTNRKTRRPNGERDTDNQKAAAAALPDDLMASVGDLPNIDGRESVLTELPKNLIMEDRQDFAVAQKSKPAGIEFGHPKDWAMCHPDRNRRKIMLCIKDAENRKYLPVTRSLVADYPKLQTSCRPFIVRQAILLDGPWFLWPCPCPGGREFPGDSMHLDAMNSSMEDWVKMTWVGGDWDVSNTDPKFVYNHPDWDTAEDFESFLTRGLGPLVLQTGDEPFLRRFLGRGR